MKYIPSGKLRFIFNKKKEELDHAVNSKTLNKYDSNQISKFNHMSEHVKPRILAKDLKGSDGMVDKALIPEMTFTEKQKKYVFNNFNILHISPSTLDIIKIQNHHINAPHLNEHSEQQINYMNEIGNLKFNVKYLEKEEKLPKCYTAGNDIFNTIDKKYNKYAGSTEDPV